MRYAVILAGGSGTRLWPLSRMEEPKQLIPVQNGTSLLELALERLEGVVEPDRRLVCAGEKHREAVARRLPALPDRSYLGEPEARDTLAALAFSVSVVAREDPHAVIGVFTADQIIRPVEQFRRIVASAYELAEANRGLFVTFGVTPTHAATGYGYLELAEELAPGARRVSRFREKPDAATAARFLDAGADRYLWNSGMFVFGAEVFLDRLGRYEAAVAMGARRIALAWGTDGQVRVLREVYPTLRKVSFDVGIMEPASVDPEVAIAAIPLPLEWLDVGSWPAFATIFEPDAAGNRAAAGRCVLDGCTDTLVVSDDPEHLIAAVGCDDLIVVHTSRATLVCRKDRAEEIKRVQALVAERFGDRYL